MRVKITDEEAATVGVFKDTPGDGPNAWGPKIAPLLIAKGVPKEFLEVGDMRCVPIDRHSDGVVFLVADAL